MTEQFRVKSCGGEVAFDDRPQEIMARTDDRVGGYVANTGPGTLTLFFGEVVQLAPFRGVLLPVDYQGPVKISGRYMDRFAAVEFIRDTQP